MTQMVQHWTLTRETKVRLPAAFCAVMLSMPLMHSYFGPLSRWIMNEQQALCLREATTLSAVKPWSNFQCTGIHHAVRAWTYEGDEHLA